MTLYDKNRNCRNIPGSLSKPYPRSHMYSATVVASLYQVLNKLQDIMQLQSDLKKGDYRIPNVTWMPRLLQGMLRRNEWKYEK